MKLAVTDANIFIDLIELKLISCLFNCGMDIYTSQEVMDQLRDDQLVQLEPFCNAGTLRVVLFSATEIQEILALPCPRSLEFADKSVIYLARLKGATVLTGDAPLRKYCASNHLPVLGILGLFDLFCDVGQITTAVAAERLTYLMSFNGRLPKHECEHRLSKWRPMQKG